MKKLFLILFLCTTLFLFKPFSVEASSLSLSPSTVKVAPGKTFSVSIILNSAGESVNAVSANLNYPSDKLEAVSISESSAFPVTAEKFYGNGSIKLSRGTISGVNGKVNLAAITFKAKTEGIAIISFSNTSAATKTSDSTDSLTSILGSSVQIAGTPTLPKSSTSGSLPFRIKNIKVTGVSTDSASISWQTDIKTDSSIEYGLDKDTYFYSIKDPKLMNDHNLTLTGPALYAGTLYHFRIKSTGVQAGEYDQSADQTVLLKGYSVQVKILTSQRTPLSGAQVSVAGYEKHAVSDFSGSANFENLKPGENILIMKYKDLEKTQKIEVKPLSQLQNVEVVWDYKINNNFAFLTDNPLLSLILLSGIIVLITVITVVKILKS